jgi:hypothetical protein
VGFIFFGYVVLPIIRQPAADTFPESSEGFV